MGIVVGIRRWRGYRSTAVYVSLSVGTVAWRRKHHAFIVEEYIRNWGSVITTQRAFRIWFELGWMILFRIEKLFKFRYQTSEQQVLRWKENCLAYLATPQNVASVTASIKQPPKCSARKPCRGRCLVTRRNHSSHFTAFSSNRELFLDIFSLCEEKSPGTQSPPIYQLDIVFFGGI